MEVTNSDPIRINRSGRVSKPCDHVAKFPETAHAQIYSGKGNWIKPCYCDDIDMVNHLSKGKFYQDSYFSEEVV